MPYLEAEFRFCTRASADDGNVVKMNENEATVEKRKILTAKFSFYFAMCFLFSDIIAALVSV